MSCLKLPAECENVREEVWAKSEELKRTTSGVCGGRLVHALIKSRGERCGQALEICQFSK